MKSQHFSIRVLKAKEDEMNKIILGAMKHSCVVFEEFLNTEQYQQSSGKHTCGTQQFVTYIYTEVDQRQVT